MTGFIEQFGDISDPRMNRTKKHKLIDILFITQAVADLTMNVIRPSAGFAPISIANISPDFDPSRDKGDGAYPGDYEVNPVLREIRRERRVKLFMENFRFDDLRRWKKAQYALRQKKGQWVSKTKLAVLDKLGTAYARNTLNLTAFTIDRAGDAGYLTFHQASTRLWPEYYYLYPVSTDQLVLNKKPEQKTGWK